MIIVGSSRHAHLGGLQLVGDDLGNAEVWSKGVR